MDKLGCMHTFCAVVKEGGFSAAARKMGTSKVMVSRNVSALENDLGIRLLQRTTRKMSPTDDGLAYYERCRNLLEDFDDLENTIKDRGQHASGCLRISVPSEAFTERHLLPFFADFAHQHPTLELDIVLADRYVDIVDEGFDAAVRIGRLEDSSLIAKKLAEMELILCASPSYLDTHPPIKHPDDLKHHQLTIDSNYRGGLSGIFSRGKERLTVRFKGRIRINSPLGASTLIRQGFGPGICPSFIVSEELAKGELRRVLADWELMRGGIYLVYSHRKHLSAKVKLLLEAIASHFQQQQF